MDKKPLAQKIAPLDYFMRSYGDQATASLGTKRLSELQAGDFIYQVFPWKKLPTVCQVLPSSTHGEIFAARPLSYAFEDEVSGYLVRVAQLNDYRDSDGDIHVSNLELEISLAATHKYFPERDDLTSRWGTTTDPESTVFTSASAAIRFMTSVLQNSINNLNAEIEELTSSDTLAMIGRMEKSFPPSGFKSEIRTFDRLSIDYAKEIQVQTMTELKLFLSDKTIPIKERLLAFDRLDTLHCANSVEDAIDLLKKKLFSETTDMGVDFANWILKVKPLRTGEVNIGKALEWFVDMREQYMINANLSVEDTALFWQQVDTLKELVTELPFNRIFIPSTKQ